MSVQRKEWQLNHPNDEFALDVLRRDLEMYRQKRQTALTHIKWLEGVIDHTEQAIKELEAGRVEGSGGVKAGEFARMRLLPATLSYLERYAEPSEMVPIRERLQPALAFGGAVDTKGILLSSKPEKEQYRSLMNAISDADRRGKIRYEKSSDTVGLPQPHLLK
jgi:hypothetical protein